MGEVQSSTMGHGYFDHQLGPISLHNGTIPVYVFSMNSVNIWRKHWAGTFTEVALFERGLLSTFECRDQGIF